jgi:hypothetical protein
MRQPIRNPMKRILEPKVLEVIVRWVQLKS